MVERETQGLEFWSIERPEHKDFKPAYDLLWQAFGPQGEMEREKAIRQFLKDDSYEPTPTGTYIRYFLLVAKDKQGNIRGVRDGSVLVNPKYASDLCVVYLSHIFTVPEARGTVLSYWLRIAPMEIATQYLRDLHELGKIKLPAPELPGKHFGMRVDLAAEMEYFSPEDRISWQRILFYGRGGFDAIDPRHFPYLQPDFRDPNVVKKTGDRPMPFMVLLRRMGREKHALLPIDEARAVMRLLYDDFACHCAPDTLASSLQLVLDRLEERAKKKEFVQLLPLPTGPKNLKRLRKFFRHRVYTKYYPNVPATHDYLESGIRKKLRDNPHYLDEALAEIAGELEARPAYVYENRNQDFTWEGLPIPPSTDGRSERREQKKREKQMHRAER
ncbi:MAG: hypothetical protein JWP87_5531 [Labilithrix sp.]|nr:hypothetical protein [Labilithrix sp.]